MAEVFIAIQKGKAEEAEEWFRESLPGARLYIQQFGSWESLWNCIICHHCCLKAELEESRNCHMDSSKSSQHQLDGGDGMGHSPTCHPQWKDTHSQTSGPQTSWYLQTPGFYLSLSWNRKVSNPMFLIAKNHGTFLWEIQFRKEKTLSSFPILFFFFFQFVRRQLIPIFGSSHIPTTHSWLYPHTFICSNLSPLHEISQTTRTHKISICITSHGLPTDLFRLGGERGAWIKE